MKGLKHDMKAALEIDTMLLECYIYLGENVNKRIGRCLCSSLGVFEAFAGFVSLGR